MPPHPHPDDDLLWAIALGWPDCPPAVIAHVGACRRCAADVWLVRLLAASRYEAKPCPQAAALVQEADGRLSRDAARRVRDHLDDCVPCGLLREALERAEGTREPAGDDAGGLGPGT